MDKFLRKCFKIKKGLKETIPDKKLAISYLETAKATLSKVVKLINNEDYLWASIRLYYAAYYSFYAFLVRIGIKSENHECSIQFVLKTIKNKELEKINILKSSRIDSQYFLKNVSKFNIMKNYKTTKIILLFFISLINDEKEINEYLK
jgi:uncharacterized protein (UPF0332 family)